jgi:hypothetical protein
MGVEEATYHGQGGEMGILVFADYLRLTRVHLLEDDHISIGDESLKESERT